MDHDELVGAAETIARREEPVCHLAKRICDRYGRRIDEDHGKSITIDFAERN